jgi:aspartyl/asparaginyl-tRNA synthetase
MQTTNKSFLRLDYEDAIDALEFDDMDYQVEFNIEFNIAVRVHVEVSADVTHILDYGNDLTMVAHRFEVP